MIKIVLCGAAGRMGNEIIQVVRNQKDIDIIAGIEIKDNENIGGEISGIKIVDAIETVIREADCVVDFTNHKACLENLEKIADFKKPFVSGTTGFTDSELDVLENFSKNFPVLISPNMSIGVNHLYNLVKNSLDALQDYDIEIVETHHKAKKDAPSGTAKAIARIIKKSLPETRFIYGREGMVGQRKNGEVCINTVRGGDVVGEHRVLFLGKGEFIEIRHYATSRQCFASGALAAVRFVVNKPPGLYHMEDLLAVRR